MSFTRLEHNVLSSDGVHILKGKILIPDGEIKGIFHLVHGMTEYIDRYDDLFARLLEEGYICCGYDNLGHGKTAANDSELGFIAEKDGWRYLVGDVRVFGDSVRKMFPDKRYFLMGHSMGSFIVRLAAEQNPTDIERLVVCGTAGPMAIANIGLGLIKLIAAVKGARYVSHLAESLAFGSYNKRFDGSTQYEWLTNDRAIIDKYIKDKYCTFKFTASAMRDLVTMTVGCNRTDWFRNISKDLPILLIAGECDPVGGYGRGVKEVYKRLLSAGHTDVTLKLYENCRHEILNDNCRRETIEDILRFLRTDTNV